MYMNIAAIYEFSCILVKRH